MSVYFKFKSAKDFNSIAIEGQFISIGTLKERIFELKHLGRGTDFDLVVSNAQTEEEYTDEAAVIPRNTSVLIRRVPGRPRKAIVAEPEEVKAVQNNYLPDITPPSSNFVTESYTMNVQESEWDDFGNDPYASIPEANQSQSFNPVMDVTTANKIDEESKIRALVETPALDWTSQNDGYRGGRGFGRGGGRMMAGRGFGRNGGGGGGFENRAPPPGYVCHRCKVSGHFIQHCPTNGDPTYDVRRVKPPTGIPKSMLMATPDGSYSLPSGAVAVLQPNEAAFDKEMEGMPRTIKASKVASENIPANLRCPLCKEGMKDAVLTSKCCFTSFCDQCIRDYIINNSKCVCGATNVLADHLIPNMTLRANIKDILESATSSTENKSGSLVQVQDYQSMVPRVQNKVVGSGSSPVVSAGSKEESKGPSVLVEDNIPELINGAENGNNSEIQLKMKGDVGGNSTPESKTGIETEKSPDRSSPLVKDSLEITNNHNRPPIADPAKKKKKKKVRPTQEEMQWRGGYIGDMGGGMVDNGFGGMQMGGPGFNPYFGGGMPVMGMDPYMAPGPHFGGPMPHFMGLPPHNPFMPPVHDPFMGQPPFMMPPGPPRDLAELAMGGVGMNMGPPPGMRWEENNMNFEPNRRPEMRRKKEMDMYSERERRDESMRDTEPRRGERRDESSRDRGESRRERRDISREREREREREQRKERRESQAQYQSARDGTSVNHKPKISSSSSARPAYPSERTERSERAPSVHDRHGKFLPRESSRQHSPRRSKRSSSDLEEAAASPPATTADPASKKQKGSVFSRISFPEVADPSKKSKKTERSSVEAPVKKSRGKEERYEAAPAVEKPSREETRYGRRGSSYDEEESSDEDIHFKRRSSRRKEAIAVEEEEEEQRRNSRRSSKDRRYTSSSTSSRHRA